MWIKITKETGCCKITPTNSPDMKIKVQIIEGPQMLSFHISGNATEFPPRTLRASFHELALLALLAIWVSSQLKHIFYGVFYCKVSVTRVSIGYSPKSHAKQATQD